MLPCFNLWQTTLEALKSRLRSCRRAHSHEVYAFLGMHAALCVHDNGLIAFHLTPVRPVQDAFVLLASWGCYITLSTGTTRQTRPSTLLGAPLINK